MSEKDFKHHRNIVNSSHAITNTKLERMFTFMLKVKTDWMNILANEQLDHNLRISKEGVSSSDYNPNADIKK